MGAKRTPRVGGGISSRKTPATAAASSGKQPSSRHELGTAANSHRRGSTNMIGIGGKVYERDSNLDKNATSLTERREIASLFYDKKVIAPLWMKVSTTPWTAYAKAAGGYGRIIDDTSVSHDAPSFMHIPAVMHHVPQTGMCGEFSGSRKAKFQHRDDTTISEDAPSWFHIPSVIAWKGHQKTNPDPGHDKMVLGKEVIFEPRMKTVDKGAINWDLMSARSARGNDTARASARAMMYSK